MERVIYTECASTTYVGQGNWVQRVRAIYYIPEDALW